MIARLGATIKYLLGKDVAGRSLRTYPDDTFIVSYPKSGNTWTRFLVASLIHSEEPMTFMKADQVIPTIDAQSRKYFKDLPRPRVIKSHFPFDQNYKRVIYIVRDPKDVAVSQYHYQIKRKVLQDGHPLEEWIPRFVAGETCPYGSWGENVGSWLAARNANPEFLLLRYEDMIRRTDVELIKVAKFLGIDPTPERIQWAIEQSTADRMRKLEQKEAGQWESTKDTRKDKFFVRSAKAGEGKSTLPPACIEQIESAWGPLMRWLGYETAANARTADTGFLGSILEQPTR
jgi:Sulfotransferase domain